MSLCPLLQIGCWGINNSRQVFPPRDPHGE
jgi:hypothetical protein